MTGHLMAAPAMWGAMSANRGLLVAWNLSRVTLLKPAASIASQVCLLQLQSASHTCAGFQTS